MKGGTSHRIRKLRQRVVTKGGGDDGKWWRREAVKEGSDDEGEWWRREVVRKGSGDEGKWRGREVMMKGSGEEGNWQPWRGVVHDVARALFWGGSRSTKPCVFRVKWLQATMKGTSSVRRVRLRSVYRFFLPQCNGGFKLLWMCLCVRSYRVFWNLCLQIALEWLHDVARALFWGGSRSTKPCVFPCKVAAGDDERYLVCAAGAAAVGLSVFFLPQCNGGFKLLWVCLCVRSYRVFWNLCLQIALEWLHDVARALFWGGSWSTKPYVFPCKVAAGDDERYLVCAAGAAAVGLSFFLPQCNGGFKLLWMCLCVRSYRVFWNLCF